mmetsp:Transcript_20614/g.64101  ORF Transcript_20614/g.64101 Transcript_20614/m.64101 type:complete len:452 (-) Transcript_20614:3138-4493(-)
MRIRCSGDRSFTSRFTPSCSTLKSATDVTIFSSVASPASPTGFSVKAVADSAITVVSSAPASVKLTGSDMLALRASTLAAPRSLPARATPATVRLRDSSRVATPKEAVAATRRASASAADATVASGFSAASASSAAGPSSSTSTAFCSSVVFSAASSTVAASCCVVVSTASPASFCDRSSDASVWIAALRSVRVTTSAPVVVLLSAAPLAARCAFSAMSALNAPTTSRFTSLRFTAAPPSCTDAAIVCAASNAAAVSFTSRADRSCCSFSVTSCRFASSFSSGTALSVTTPHRAAATTTREPALRASTVTRTAASAGLPDSIGGVNSKSLSSDSYGASITRFCSDTLCCDPRVTVALYSSMKANLSVSDVAVHDDATLSGVFSAVHRLCAVPSRAASEHVPTMRVGGRYTSDAVPHDESSDASHTRTHTFTHDAGCATRSAARSVSRTVPL